MYRYRPEQSGRVSFVYLILSQCVKTLVSLVTRRLIVAGYLLMETPTPQNRQPTTNFLRWLLRRGSPLPIPNREVKPDSADGTASLWESMSPPCFLKDLYITVKVFLFYYKL